MLCLHLSFVIYCVHSASSNQTFTMTQKPPKTDEFTSKQSTGAITVMFPILLPCWWFVFMPFEIPSWGDPHSIISPFLEIEMDDKCVVVCSSYYNEFQRWKQILGLKIWVSQWVREVPYSNLCSEQVTGVGPSFISFSHLRPWVICRALMGGRNIITAPMHTLKLSSFDLISSVFQDANCFWRRIYILQLLCADCKMFFCVVNLWSEFLLSCPLYFFAPCIPK